MIIVPITNEHIDRDTYREQALVTDGIGTPDPDPKHLVTFMCGVIL